MSSAIVNFIDIHSEDDSAWDGPNPEGTAYWDSVWNNPELYDAEVNEEVTCRRVLHKCFVKTMKAFLSDHRENDLGWIDAVTAFGDAERKNENYRVVLISWRGREWLRGLRAELEEYFPGGYADALERLLGDK